MKTLTFRLWALSGVFCYFVNAQHSGPGSTKHLPEIFQGRCEDYQTLQHPNLPKVDCQDLWTAFTNAFAYQDACEVTVDSYNEFFSLFKLDEASAKKTLFWSGVYELVSHFTEDGERLVAVADTLPGYLADGLNWCGQPNSPGIDFENCPTKAECGAHGQQYVDSFWGAASQQFAESATGMVTLFLNGTRRGRPAFETSSYFARYELPNFDVNQVSMLSIVVIQDLEVPVRETCSSGSIPELLDLVEARKIPYKCTETPSSLRHYLCVDDPGSPECAFAKKQTNFKSRFGRK